MADKLSDALMKKRKSKFEPSEDYNTSPDLREQSSSLSNSTLFDDLSGSEMGRPDSEESMYKDGGSVSKPGSGKRFAALEGKLSHQKGVTDPAALAASIGRKKYGEAKMAKWSAAGKHADGGPILDPQSAQSAQESMRKAFGHAEGGSVRIPQARSYVEYGDEMHDKEGNDISHHESIPASEGEESSMYKPKQIGNKGRATVDLNLYAQGGRVKMAYGQGKMEDDQKDTPQTYDEDSSIAYADGGSVSKPIGYSHTLREGEVEDAPLLKNEIQAQRYAEGGIAYNKGMSEPEQDDTMEQHDEASGIAYAKGGNVEDFGDSEDDLSVDDATHLRPDAEDTRQSKDEASSIAMADGGPIQDEDHNPKSSEKESQKAKRRKMMIQALNE
jgi:hypothetical protein